MGNGSGVSRGDANAITNVSSDVSAQAEPRTTRGIETRSACRSVT